MFLVIRRYQFQSLKKPHSSSYERRKNMEYKVEIQELLARTINVEANNEEEALSIVRTRYKNEEIILDSGDFLHCEMNILES